VTISHNAPEVGEGAMTMISVVAAHTLDIPQEHIVVGEPDTANDLEFAGTSSQRTTVQMGTAVHNACQALQRELAEAASRAFGGAPAEWSPGSGRLTRNEQSHTYGEIVSATGVDRLSGHGSYAHDPARDTSFGAHDYWSPGVAAVEIEVDRETGEVRLLQFAIAADAGKVLHYRSAAGQLEGGIVMGIGAALTEELHYGEGQLLNADAFQYRLPLMRDMPETMVSSMLENGDGPGPFGSKGISQVSIPCVAPAVGNAIADAVGVRLTAIPFTPEKILRALGVVSA
jgi:CO/xanthine dehydrogenase Mo-binding subunit